MHEVLKYEQREHIVILTLNDPATRNALTGEAHFAAFEQAVERMNADLNVRAAILTGEGTAFCSGGTLPISLLICASDPLRPSTFTRTSSRS